MNNREMPAPPVEVEEKEQIKIGSGAPGPVKKVVPASSGIEVVALRAGFYKNSRKVEGDKFFVTKMENVGSWMKCVDPQVEKDHQKLMLDKRKKLAGK